MLKTEEEHIVASTPALAVGAAVNNIEIESEATAQPPKPVTVIVKFTTPF